MLMLRFLIHRPIGVLMTVLSLTAVSIVFVRHVPVSLLPDIDIPRIGIHISRPGMDVRSLENTIVRPLRIQMLQINALRDIRSRTRNGAAEIEILLHDGTKTDLSLIEINEKLDQVMHLLPRDMERPRVIRSNISDIPVVFLQIAPKTGVTISRAELSRFAENIVRRRLEQLDEVSFADLHGLTQAEILVQLHEEKCIQLGIGLKQIETAIQQANSELGNVSLRDGAYEYAVVLGSKMVDIEDIAAVRIPHKGLIYRLDELAEISISEKPRRSGFLLNQMNGVSVSIRKKDKANNFNLLANLELLITDLEKIYPAIRFQLANNQSAILQASLTNLSTSLAYGILFTIGIMFLFFRDWRMPVLIASTVPVSFIFTLFCFYLFDVSINVISLSGLILGVGLMIDNAIIIVESIGQKRIELPADTAVSEGSQEMIRPLISSALTSIAVFYPLILLSGLAGALFYDQALSVTLALSNSLAVSYFLLPVLAYRMLKDQNTTKEESITHSRFISFVLDRRHPILLLFLILGLGLIPLYSKLTKQAFPNLTRDAWRMQIAWNEALPFDENERRTHQITKEADLFCKQINAYIGELQFVMSDEADQNYNEVDIHFYLKDPGGIKELQRLEARLHRNYPRAGIHIQAVKNIFDRIFIQDDYPLYLEIQSVVRSALPSREKLKPLLEELRLRGFKCSSVPEDQYIKLLIQYDKLPQYKVLEADLIHELNYLFRNNVVSQLHDADRFIPIQLSAQKEFEDIRQLIRRSSITNENNQEIPLGELVQLDSETHYKFIHASAAGEAILLGIDHFPVRFEQEIQELFRHYPEMSYTLKGSVYDNQKLIRELQLIGIVVLALLFMILAAQFESFIQPFIIALSLPMGTLGGLLALYLSGESINVISMVGIIVLLGIDVNDAIVKIDMINMCRSRGMELREAVIMGSEKRLKAILMTSLTTMLAMLPLLWSSGLGVELQRPMALTLIGGLITGTISSIVMVPIFYRLFAGRIDSR